MSLYKRRQHKQCPRDTGVLLLLPQVWCGRFSRWTRSSAPKAPGFAVSAPVPLQHRQSELYQAPAVKYNHTCKATINISVYYWLQETKLFIHKHEPKLSQVVLYCFASEQNLDKASNLGSITKKILARVHEVFFSPNILQKS